MSWIDLGVIFEVQNRADWMQSHFYVPTAIALKDRIRVFGAYWDKDMYGRLGFVDIDMEDPTTILGYSNQPLLPDSSFGKFDCDGVTPLSALSMEDGALRLYYAGWHKNPAPGVRYTLFTGLATSANNGTSFTRFTDEPVIKPKTPDCTVLTGGVVLKERSGYRCWYASFQETVTVNEKPTPAYNLSTMLSKDGVEWPEEPQIVFPVTSQIFGYGRSAIWREDGHYHGLFSVRYIRGGYRYMAHATSSDGIHWTELSADGLAFHPENTIDNQKQVCFPSLIRQKNRTLMFYNGDDFGRQGLRLAIRDTQA